ncbi:alpha/beta fold hydrolase [Halocalculus aciditolerans]|uniref:Alpha/beta hydrolase n=1 Tax=Halocalculus aciditolerans TaxID=1383812 RepID=A0A830F3V0_9EURY|nr:alpha/beta fold hydrolase [Halocalculus aciditolerans]GGL59979.1 alpha/beta hydrolase [Halocalculus aciditolerans]
MNLRNALAATAGGLAATGVANRLLERRAGHLGPPLDGRQRVHRWRGFDVAYTEAGDADDPDVLLLHGLSPAASAHEFRGVFDALSERYHVVAPDLPGFGRSDRPDVTYDAERYVQFVGDFADAVVENPTVLASGLTGAYAAMAAGRGGDDAAGGAAVDRLCLVCPTADTAVDRPWLESVLRTPVVGHGLFNALVSKPALEYLDQRDDYYHPQDVGAGVVEYQWRTAHQAGAQYAPAALFGGRLDPVVDLGSELAAVDCPVTLVWGREARTPPLAAGRTLAEDADARLVVLDESRRRPHAEHPEIVLEALAADLPRLEDD